MTEDFFFLMLLRQPSPQVATQTAKITYNLTHKIPTYKVEKNGLE